MSVRCARNTKTILVPPAYRGNCDCGRWIIVALSFSADNPLRCECGAAYYWEGDKFRREGFSDTEKHLKFIAAQKLLEEYKREMRAIVDVILHHGGGDFPIMTFDSAAEAVDALITKLSNVSPRNKESDGNAFYQG